MRFQTNLAFRNPSLHRIQLVPRPSYGAFHQSKRRLLLLPWRLKGLQRIWVVCFAGVTLWSYVRFQLTFRCSYWHYIVRFNALSRTIESALQKEGIPSRVLGGHKFFERLEVWNMLYCVHISQFCSRSKIFLRTCSWWITLILYRPLRELSTPQVVVSVRKYVRFSSPSPHSEWIEIVYLLD